MSTRFTVTFTKRSKDDRVGFHLTKRSVDGSIVVASSREGTGLSKGDEIIFINGVRVKPLIGEQAFDILKRSEGQVTIVAEAKRPLDLRDLSGCRGNNSSPGINGRSGSDGNGSHGLSGVDASMAVKGSDAGNIKIRLGSLAQGPDDAKFDFHNSKVVLRAIGGDGGDGAKGGDGGDGGRGRRGSNATEYRRGTNGKIGGGGGDGGRGSSGANGGNGGLVELYVTTNETYLLMSVEDLENPTTCVVHKGTGGRPGKHGRPGRAGSGGAGGSSYSWTTTVNDEKRSYTNPGGCSGPSGKNGILPTAPLHTGRDGGHGRLVIYEHTGKYGDYLLGQYSSRYDLKLAGFSLSAEHRIENTVFQFGDTVTVSDITAQNTGGMATPTYPVFLEVAAQSLIHPIAIKKACVNESVDVSCIGSAVGSLLYHIPIPSLPRKGGEEIDFDPFVQEVDMQLDAFQEGPPGFNYRRSYPAFDPTGTLLSFRFPVENPSGFISLASLIAGETMKVQLPLRNLFSQDIGYDTLSKRQFMVQFRRLQSHIHDMPVSDAKLTMGGIACEDLDSVDEIWWGTVISIPNVPGHSQIGLEGNLRVSEQARPYSRLRVQAGLMLQDLPLNMDNPSFSLTQLRKLDIVAEPSYERKANNQCILITSSSTREDVFNHWKFLLEESLGLEVEYLPVSVYGSLDPDFILPSGQKVRDAFDEKLVIVFDYIFDPSHDGIDEMRPSSMLPNGCMPQTSGYKRSTRWLFVGTDRKSCEAELACHYTAPPNDITTHDGMDSFMKKLREQIFQERVYGAAKDLEIQSEVISIRRRAKSCSLAKALNILKKEAKSFAKFIRSRDKLRQYIVETKVDLQQLDSKSMKIGEIIIRRGYIRSMDSAGVIRKPGDVVNKGTMFSIFRNMPIRTRIQRFCYHLGKDDKEIVAVIVDSIAIGLVWELANYIHGQYKHSPRFDENFPVVTSFFGNSDVSALLEAKSTSEVSWAFNSLFACFECVANSKDLRPRSLPFSRLRLVRNHLVALVKRLEQHWKVLIDQKTVSKYKTRLKGNVRSYLSQDRKVFFYRCNNRWREGLRFAFAGKSEYVESRAEPLMNCQSQSQNKKFENRAKIFKPDVQVLTSHDCEVLMMAAQTRNALSAELLQAIRGARADRILEEEDEPEIAVGPCDSISVRFSGRSLSAVPPVPVAATAPVEPDIAIGPLDFEGTAPSEGDVYDEESRR